MATQTIADSDGEESGSDSATSEILPDAHTRSTERPSPTVAVNPSTSTDSNFFKCVLEEQREAALQQMNEQGPPRTDSSEGMDPVSFDQGFERTVSNAKISLPDRSPWDVPSSPEACKPRKPQKQSSVARTKITRGLKRQLDDIGYMSEDDDPEIAHNASPHSRKRGKLRAALDDHVPELSILSHDTRTLLPPVHADAGGHANAGDKSTSPPPRILDARSANIRSSGTATNVNTPRSNTTVSIEISSNRPPTSDRIKERGSGSMSSPEALSRDLQIMNERKGTSLRKQVIVSPDKDDLVQDDQLNLEKPERPDSTDPTATSGKAVAKKKQRGRPRKLVNEAPVADETVAIEIKKKRGRPKKAIPTQQDNDEGPVTIGVSRADTDMASTTSKVAPSLDVRQDVPVATSSMHVDLGVGETDGSKPVQERKDPVESNAIKMKEQGARVSLSVTKDSARPSYRVGLSKRTRIAPLLKVIRK